LTFVYGKEDLMDTLTKRNHRSEKFFNDSNELFFGRSIEDTFADLFFESHDVFIWDEGNAYLIQLPLPGMHRRDISLEIDDSIMRVSGKRLDKNRSWNAIKFSNRHFMRSFTLPADADANNITAKCRNGLLVIRIRKTKVNGLRVIEVDGSNVSTYNKFHSWWNIITQKLKQRFK
jgi:HSP20 family protein